eukprot:CAMPEP_0184746728 /NCGR_PEP_ID=MMETSP0315-20130426/9259_1 /TAXON_ID=101924 /ORGANISM="Rhodosorus marinus, Strain UTEX LB 2760" /LENGTH=228 /DNA_ID=CAMNT_0027219443 /DNA_START=79 /DNA_END=762 /DNA_ORIENTATION=-
MADLAAGEGMGLAELQTSVHEFGEAMRRSGSEQPAKASKIRRLSPESGKVPDDLDEYELFFGEVRYNEPGVCQNGTYNFPSSAMTGGCPKDVKTLRHECLSRAPEERPEFGTSMVRLEGTLSGLDPGRETSLDPIQRTESPGEVGDKLSTDMSDEGDDESSKKESRKRRRNGQTSQEQAVASTSGPEQPANGGKTRRLSPESGRDPEDLDNRGFGALGRTTAGANWDL